MKNRNVKTEPFFFLAPPLISQRGYGFAVIQLGVDFSETMMMRLNEWSPRMFLAFWLNELTELVNGIRKKGLLPCGIYRDLATGKIRLGERWEAFRCGDEFAFHDRTVVFDDDPILFSSSQTNPEVWWQLIPDYIRMPVVQNNCDVEYESEWRVTVDSVADWCHKYSCVLAQMDNVDSDVEFSW